MTTTNRIVTSIADDPRIQRLRPSFETIIGRHPTPVDIDGRPGLSNREQFWAMEVPESLAVPGPVRGNLREFADRPWEGVTRDRSTLVTSSIYRDDLVRPYKIALLHGLMRNGHIPLAAVDARTYAFFRRRFPTAIVRAGGRKPVLFLESEDAGAEIGAERLVAAIMPIHLDRWAPRRPRAPRITT